MRSKVLFLALVCGSSLFTHASAANIWLSQTAQTPYSGGGNCNGNNTSAVTFFNTSGNWGAGGTQIGAGTVVHLCGTFTTVLTFQGGGGSGNPVEVLFESGASIQISPGTAANSGDLNLGANSNILVDGGAGQPCGWNTATNASEGSCNGQVENMLFGTSGATCPGGACTSQPTVGGVIYGQGSNVEIRNLRVGPSYVHNAMGNGVTGTVNTSGSTVTFVSGTNFSTCGSSTTTCPFIVVNTSGTPVEYATSAISNTSATVIGTIGTQSGVTYWIGNDGGGTACGTIDTGATDWNVHDNQFDDAGWCLILNWISGTTSNITIQNNYFVNDSHDMAIEGTGTLNGFNFIGNFTSDMCTSASLCWDTQGDDWHGDALHFFTSSGSGTAENIAIYNNIFGGNTGIDVTGQVFSEEFTSYNNFAMFNNLFAMYSNPQTSASNHGWGPAECDSGCYVYNNTVNRAIEGGSNFDLGYSTYTMDVTLENNVDQNGFFLMTTSGSNHSITLDYNAYGPNGGGIWSWLGSSTSSFSTWKTSSSEGTHSFYNSSTLGLDANSKPTSGSALRSAGLNVCNSNPSFCTTYPAIKSDLAGNVRPTGSTAWDIGAYQYSSGSTYTITISSITGSGTITSSDSVLNCTTGTTGTCTDSTATGTITLTESPGSGYSFTSWGGGTCSGSSSTCAVTSAATVTATFTANATSGITANGLALKGIVSQ